MSGVPDTFSFATVDVPGAAGFTKVSSINNLGEVAGVYVGPDSLQGFTEDNGAFTTIAVPRSVLGTTTHTLANGINDQGKVVGQYLAIGTGNSQGFVEDHGTFAYIDVPDSMAVVPGGYGFPPYTQIHGINDKGDLVGEYGDTNRHLHGFADHNGAFTSIDVPNALTTQAEGINNTGDIVGTYSAAGHGHGYIDHDSTFTTIDVPGAVSTNVSGVNDEGMLVGTYTDSSMKSHGFIYDNGSFTPIDFPGASGTEARGINDWGQIAGDYSDSNGTYHGFVANPLSGPAEGALASLKDLLAGQPAALSMNDFVSAARAAITGLTSHDNQPTGASAGASVCMGSNDTAASCAAAAMLAHAG